MTYSPFLSAAPSDDTPSLASSSDALLARVSCLLHCPIDTPQLWPQVLAILSSAFSCSSAQLFLPDTISTSPHYLWEAKQPEVPAQEIPTPAAVTALWRYLGIRQAEIDVLWQHQANDLQAQLATLAAGEDFRIKGAQAYSGREWPFSLTQIFGDSQGRELIVLPLCYESENQPAERCCHTPYISAPYKTAVTATQPSSCLGVLALLRSPEQTWSSCEKRLLESVGSQIYLALRRSHLDQVARTRSAYDQLTQLPDRMLFNQQLGRSIAMAAQQDTMLGVAFLDLDRFKNINDTLGHEAGDCLLQQVAKRLKGCLRNYDFVARWGGDEFTLLLSNLRSAEDVSSIAERLLQRLSAPFQVQGEELYVTASLGIALAPYDGEDGPTLLRNADAAMYQAKSQGRNNYQVYFEEINANARRQLNLETDLRKAIDNHELFLCYQPQVDLISGQWVGLEALIRWQHPTIGLISPAKFIPIAEETGLIETIGYWVLQEACTQYGKWQQMGMPKIRLAVNLSAHQFHHSYLARSILQILKTTGFDPRYLELEVTESAAMYDVGFAISLLEKLSKAGMQIAMDDFGTGYSSLSVLKHFPLDTLKIDRSFVMDLVDSPKDAAIAATIIALAKGLNFKVLAEGIETPAQATVLRKMGCDYAQGYWFSRPLTVQHIDGLLNQQKFSQTAKLS
ncbi:MAG: EAL domain-containing protein [Phormidesmis sp.]